MFGDDWLPQLSSSSSGPGPQLHQERRPNDLRPYSHGEQILYAVIVVLAFCRYLKDVFKNPTSDPKLLQRPVMLPTQTHMLLLMKAFE